MAVKAYDKYEEAAREGAANGTTSSGVTNVVLLPTGEREGYYSAGRGGWTPPANEAYTETQATDYFIRMTDAQRRKLAKYHAAFGKALGYESPRSMWGAVVTASINSGQTPWEILSAQSGKKPPADPNGPGAGPNGPSGPAAYTGPVSRIDLTNEFDAEALLDAALGQYLGRSASPKELGKFKSMLLKHETSNPSTVTPVGDALQIGSGGASPEALAKDFAQSRGNYAETQVDTTLMSWMEEALTNKNRMV